MVKRTKSRKCLNGKTAIITGANAGIGYETALELATRGCRIIMACRNEKKAKSAKEKITQITENQNVFVKLLNLESLQSVREFAKDINENEPRLDLLINNAGAVEYHDKLTDDGLQLMMVVNYFSPFLLTNLLLDLLKKSSPSRVINVSSVTARFVDLKLEELNVYDGQMKTYARTKLCNILFTRELASRLANTGVSTYSLHPGVVNTEIYTVHNKLIKWLKKLCTKSCSEGAQTTIYLCLEDNLENFNGRHFVDCEAVNDYNSAKDMNKAQELWEISEKSVMGSK